jgi:hypothetical protein
MISLACVLMGMTAMAALTVALFFLHFWRQTRDSFFIFFALAFAIDAVAWFALGVLQLPERDQPILFIPRLGMFALIIAAIVFKNRGAARH